MVSTSNGISFQDSKTGQWHSFLSSYDKQLKDKNHIFITLCEVSPGVIWAGGYTSGIYKINKKTLSVEYFSPFLLSSVNIRPDKYIRDMIKDSKGYIWSGGYYNLKCIDPRKILSGCIPESILLRRLRKKILISCGWGQLLDFFCLTGIPVNISIY